MTNCVIYARVSSKEQEREGFSIPAQLELLENYAKKQNFNICEKFIDIETAKRTGRTNFVKMLAYLKKHKDIKTILVEKTDRLYRNLPDYVTIDELNLDLHFVKEGVTINDNSHSSEKFMHLIKVGMAKQYIDNLSEEVRKGIAQKCKEGLYPAKAPVGYLNVENKDKKKIIVPDPATAPYIQKCYEMYLTGLYSFKSLAKKLTDDGFLINGKPCRKGNVEVILANPIYYGDFIHKGVKYTGKHTPIISHELWVAVQEKKHLTGSPRVITHNFPYTNMIKCAKCGCYLTAEIKKGKYIYYHCTGNKGGNCKRSYIRQEIIEKAIAEILQKLYISDNDIIRVKDTVKELLQLTEQYDENKIDTLHATIKRLKNRLNKLYIDKIDGIIDDEFYNENRALWQSELDDAQIGLNAILKNNKYFIEDVGRMLELCKNASILYLNESDDEKRKLVNIMCSNLSWDGDNIHIELKSAFGQLLKCANYKNSGASRQSSNFDKIKYLSKYFIDNISNKELITLFEQLRAENCA
jgi:DNA invertase Pin-like site-specific DNA recombinase